MPSKLLGKGWPEVTLSVATGEPIPDPDGALDDDGNLVLVPQTVDLVVQLEATTNGQIRDQVGADANTLALEGRCLDPVRFPDGVKPGATASLAIEGTVGTLTILPWYAGQHTKVVDKLGQRFAAKWVAA